MENGGFLMQNMENNLYKNPKISLTIAPAFKDLWQTDFREYIYYGGRYGGKNYAIAQYLCVKLLQKRQRALILREFGVRGKDSVYKDIKDFFVENDIEFKINDLDLEIKQYYKNENLIKFKATRILLTFNQSEFIFAGVNDNVVDSLKGLKDINFCWIDEANFLSEYSYNKLKPTIRAENSKLIYSFNPEQEDDFLYKKAITNKDERCYVKKITAGRYDSQKGEWVCGDNPFLNATILADINSDFKTMTSQMFNFVHLGEPLGVENGNVINTDLIGFYDDCIWQGYTQTILSADTAFSKSENADYSAIGAFGLKGNEIHLLRIWRGHYDFNELQEVLKGAYSYVSDKYQLPPARVIIEKKASGISLLQELQRTTHLPLSEVVPKKDKFARVSNVLSEFGKLRLPQSKDPINFWISDFIKECKAFRADLAHLHDDQVDMVCYALEYQKGFSIDWDSL